jgi:tripartite-type tricarboxylate transporter receptor subunit TctC
MTMAGLSLRCSLVAMLAACSLGSAGAQTPATPPIKVIIGYAAGGPLDTITRLVAKSMSDSMKQTIIVENRTGASGLLAIDAVKKAPADGSTILVTNSAFVVNPMMMQKAPYDPSTDFVPIGRIANLPIVVITAPSTGITSMRNLVAAARGAPETISFGTPGVGGPAHLAGELLQALTGTKMIHVPYKGSSAVLPDVLAGRVSFTFQVATGLRQLVDIGQVRALAVVGSRERLPELPNVPTMAEEGFPGFEDAGGWAGMLSPAKTPPAVVAKFSQALQSTLEQTDIQQQIIGAGAVPTVGTPKEFETFLASDISRWRGIIKAAKITITE